MLTKNELKLYSSLLQKKYRDVEGKFIIEGKRLVEEGIKSSVNCEIVIVTELFKSKNENFSSEIAKQNIRIEVVNASEFNKLTDTKNPQGIAAIFHKFITSVTESHDNIVVALENISEPGNLGTYLRNCDWFGINYVLIDSKCADIYNPKVLRSSMGSVFHINISQSLDYYSELNDLKRKGYSLCCADIEGKNIFQFKPGKNLVIVFANEADGPSSKLLEIADEKITIPRIGQAESLNVASASAVILSQLTKKN